MSQVNRQHDKISVAESVVEKQLAYYNANDLEGFASTYAEDIEIYDLPEGTLRFKTREELLNRYGKTFALKPKARIASRIVEGNKVIDHEFYMREGMTEEGAVVAIYEVDTEKALIAKVWFIK